MRPTSYNELARRLADPKLVFLNYGLAQSADESWDWIREGDQPHKYHLNLVRHALRGIDLKGKRVLEIGCGRGGNCAYLSRYTEAAEIIGLDRAQGNIGLGRRLHRGLRGVSFAVGEAERIGFASGQLDVVLSLEAAHTHLDFGSFLGEVHRLLRTGGDFCLADLWGLEQLECDWSERRRLLRGSPLALLTEEDISEPVARAFRAADGLKRLLTEIAGADNRDLIDGIVRGMEILQTSLQSGSCRYKVWRFRKGS